MYFTMQLLECAARTEAVHWKDDAGYEVLVDGHGRPKHALGTSRVRLEWFYY